MTLTVSPNRFNVVPNKHIEPSNLAEARGHSQSPRDHFIDHILRVVDKRLLWCARHLLMQWGPNRGQVQSVNNAGSEVKSIQILDSTHQAQSHRPSMSMGASVGWASLASLAARTAAAPVHSRRSASMASVVRRSIVASGGGGGARILPFRTLSSGVPQMASSSSSHGRSGTLWLLGTAAGGCSAAWAVLHATRQTRAACDGVPPGTTLRMALCQMSVTSDKLRNINVAKVSNAFSYQQAQHMWRGVGAAKMRCVRYILILLWPRLFIV